MKLLATLILGLTIACVATTAEANLLGNAGFEDASPGAWWGPWGNAQHDGTYGDTGTGISGSNSVKFVSNATAGTGDDYYMYDNGLVSVTPDTTYYGSIYAKTQSLVNEEVFVKIDWFNSGAWAGTAGGSSIITGTNDWTLLQISGAAPSDATHASLAFFINQTVDGGSGTVYFDNAHLDSAPVPEPSTLFLLTSGLAGLFAVVRKKR